ncbi:MAG: hypothetical protein LM576_07330 [Thermofilum sp.]|jgi:hypothetical protein|nr:hypothetical protein [Thermofilum sp.]
MSKPEETKEESKAPVVVEAICKGDRDACESLKMLFFEMLQKLCDHGICLKKVVLIARKSNELVKLQLQAFDIASIDAFGVFLLDREKPFELVSSLSAVLSSYLYSSGVLPWCPRWVIEGVSLYYALRVYTEVDASSATLVEKYYLDEADRAGVNVSALSSWTYKEHPALKALSNVLPGKVYRALQALFTIESEKGDRLATSFKAVSYVLIKRALESMSSGVKAEETLKLLASFGEKCSEKILEQSR